MSSGDATERLQLALEAGAIVGTWVWDIFADHFVADERFARSFGLSAQLCRDGLAADKVCESIHPDDRQRVETAVIEAMARGGPYRCEYRVRQSDGVYRWVEANGRAELDEQGRAVRFPGVLMDIESRRVAEAERDRMAALLRIFTAAVPGVVYAKDLQGRMLVANQGTTDLIGKPPSFYLGKTDLEFLADKRQARQVMANDQRIMHGGKAEQIEEQVDMPDGSEVTWLSLKAPLLNDSGEVIGLIGSSVDVTDRKKAERALQELNLTLEDRVAAAIAEREVAEAALRQSQKMEAVGQLTGGIAHDFNNLLAGISGCHELMNTRLEQGRPGDVKRYLATAQGATRRAAALTHRLLAFSRRQTLASVPTDVNALVSGMQELVNRSVGPSIDVEIHLAPELWTALIDPAQLESALLNLCINSRDAMPEGGKICIDTLNTRVTQDTGLDHTVAHGNYLVVSVTDSGLGMSADTAARAFEPFFTTKPVGAGTGLGLSMVYGFARQSGGDVQIHSTEGRGTRIDVYLPRHLHDSVEPCLQPPVADSSQAVSGQTVLLVDDEPSIRMLVSDVLTQLGYSVLEAADSKTGLHILQSDVRIDVLISDVGLPGGLNGRQMADRGRRGRPGLPVLFITGYAEANVLDHDYQEPCTAVLTKPFALEALVAQVGALLKG
ncbi:PAS domain-containing sensor histidine kinase [Pseudomonas sp. 3A(2025)]